MNQLPFSTSPLRKNRTLSLLASLMMVAGLAGCASGVSLDEVPVSDRSGTPVSALGQGDANAAAQGSGAAAGGVSAVQVGSAQDAQPDQLSRIVYFDFDSFVVKPEYTGLLEANARYLKANAQRRVSLEGHTDERGGREYNLALGQKRAEAVRRALSLLGVNEQQMEPVSFGEEKPAVSGLDESAFGKNRRVEFTYR